MDYTLVQSCIYTMHINGFEITYIIFEHFYSLVFCVCPYVCINSCTVQSKRDTNGFYSVVKISYLIRGKRKLYITNVE